MSGGGDVCQGAADPFSLSLPGLSHLRWASFPLLRTFPGTARMEVPLSWRVQDLSDLRSVQAMPAVSVLCPLQWVLPKARDFLHGLPVCGILAAFHIQAQDCTSHTPARGGQCGSSDRFSVLVVQHFLLAERGARPWASAWDRHLW